jgi:hypothetical protein
MTDVNWRISGIQLANCNCAWGCPCQFNALPTTGQCEAVWSMRIDEGHFGNIRLDGLKWGMLFWWPGAVHEGNGKLQLFGEDRATTSQREALETIAHGKASDEGTYFQIFAAVAPNFQPSVWAPVEFECDIDKRTGRLAVADLVEASVEPIRNPVTNAEQRARVVLPDGFEYREAEYASGKAKSSGSIALNHQGTHAHLYRSGWDAHGIAAD